MLVHLPISRLGEQMKNIGIFCACGKPAKVKGACLKCYRHNQYENNKEREIHTAEVWNAANKDRCKQLRQDRYKLDPSKAGASYRKWKDAHPKEYLCRLAENAQNHSEKKRQVLTHYSPNGVLCCCWSDCTIADLDMLSLDHIENNGAAQRKQLAANGSGGGIKLYRWVIKNKFPEGLQTLCMNHQYKKQLMLQRQVRDIALQKEENV
jgi:hypothetical protein